VPCSKGFEERYHSAASTSGNCERPADLPGKAPVGLPLSHDDFALTVVAM
jgi:hypothetical protein